MPWSTALRIRWFSGSLILSITVRSNSVCPSLVWKSIFLPSFCAVSLTIRGNRLNANSKGIMRIAIILSCKLRVWEFIWSIEAKTSWLSSTSNTLLIWSSNMALLVTSSPTILISVSTLSTATRMNDVSLFWTDLAATFLCGFGFCAAFSAVVPLSPVAGSSSTQASALMLILASSSTNIKASWRTSTDADVSASIWNDKYISSSQISYSGGTLS